MDGIEELEAPKDADGMYIKIGDRLQITGREDKPIEIDGMVVLPTYYSESAGRSCAVVRPELWHVVDDVTEPDDSWESIIYAAKNYCENTSIEKCYGRKCKQCEVELVESLVRRCKELAEREARR